MNDQKAPEGAKTEDKPADSPTPAKLFLLYAKINAITLGGGYVIVPVMGSALEKRGWIQEDDFYDIFARAQAFPGPLALSTAILTAMRLCGIKGAIAAFFGVILPPFAALILVSKLVSTYGSLPPVQRFLDGAGAVVPGLVGAMIWRSAKKRTWNPARVAETVILSVVLILLPAYSLPVLLAGIFSLYFIEAKCRRSK